MGIDLSRRQFTSSMAAGIGGLLVSAGPVVAQGSALPATPVGRPQPDLETAPAGPVSEKLGWAVVGLGDFAQGYVLPALNRARYSKAVALVSGNAEKAREVAARHAIEDRRIHSYNDMARMRDDDAIDVVYIVTPNSTHADLTVRAFEAGKHVMCEKPMATNAADCQRMIDAAKAANRKLMIAYRAHFEPYNLVAKEMIDDGRLGEVHFAASDHHRPLNPSLPRDEWRMKKAIAGGGSLVDIGIYSLNGIQWFFGESPNAVCATVFSPSGDERFAEVEDLMTAQLVFPSGRRANISSGYTAAKKRIDLFGSAGTAVLDPATEYSGNRLTLSTSKGTHEPKAGEPSEVQFTGEIDHLSLCIRNGEDVLTPGEMGLRDMRIIEALYESASTGQWVELRDPVD